MKTTLLFSFEGNNYLLHFTTPNLTVKCCLYRYREGELCGQLFGVSRVTVTAAVTVPLILLSWIRSFRELTIFTAIGVIGLIISIFVILIDGLRETTGEIIENTPLFLPIGKTLSFIGPATFCYTIHYCVLAMGAEGLVCVKNEKILYSDQSMKNLKKGRVTVLEEMKKLNSIPHTTSFNVNDENDDDDNFEKLIGTNCNDNENGDEKIEGNRNRNNLNLNDHQIAKNISNSRIDVSSTNKDVNICTVDKVHENITLHKIDTEIPFYPHMNEALSESPKRKLQSVLTDISSPLGTAYLLTSILNITFGGVGYAFYREAEIIR